VTLADAAARLDHRAGTLDPESVGLVPLVTYAEASDIVRASFARGVTEARA
jgi:hypothetical protein